MKQPRGKAQPKWQATGKRRRALQRRRLQNSQAAAKVPDYLHSIFLELVKETREALNAATIEPAGEGRAYWGSSKFTGTWLGETAWEYLNGYLGLVENRIKAIVEQHSVFYWVHLYRRIGIGLHPLLDDDPDGTTLSLVRSIMEVAFVRYGASGDAAGDMGLSSQMKLEEVAGGLLLKALRNELLRTDAHVDIAIDAFGEALRTGNKQWMLRKFSATDYVQIARLEGLAYEYWLTTARMRRVGKGGAIVVAPGGAVRSASPPGLEPLIQSYDARIEAIPFDHSSTGGGFYAKPAPGQLWGIGASYNVRKLLWAETCLDAGIGRLLPHLATNFVLAPLSLGAFADAHAFVAEAYKKARGFSIQSLCGYVAAVTLWAPWTAAGFKTAEARLVAWKELYQRGYLVNPTATLEPELTSIAIEQMNTWLGPGKHNIEQEAALVHEFLTLRSEKRTRPGLWSLGPRYLFLHYGEATIVDLHALQAILMNAFVGISYDQDVKGVAFEAEFRKYV